MSTKRIWLLPVTQNVLICLIACTASVFGRSGTPPNNSTGAPGHNNCAQCHTSSGNGNVSLSFPGNSGYNPGQNYSLSVLVTDPTKTRFGFSMVARDTSNNTVDVGTWSAGSNDTQTHGPGGSHVGHRNAPFDQGSHTFTVNWQAPASGVGDVTFYVASVAANGNGINGTGDNVYLRQLTISQQLPPNQSPSLTVPGGTLDVVAEVATAIAGISVDDADAGAGNVTVTLSADN